MTEPRHAASSAPTRGPSIATIAAVVAIAVLWGHGLILGDAYTARLISLAGIAAILVLGYQLIFGHAGALSLAHGAFFAVGAYVAGLLSVRMDLPFILTVSAATTAGAVAALVVAVPVLRLQTHAFALATLAFAQLALLVALHGGEFTGGANGIVGVARPEIAGWTVPRGMPHAALIWIFVALAAFVVHRATAGYRRQAFAVARTDPIAAAAMGIDPATLRVRAFVLAGLLAGLAGALQAHTLGVVSPETAQFEVLVTTLAMTVIGGANRIAGAVLGAVLLIHLPEWLRDLDGWYLFAYGAALLATIVFIPEGLAGQLDRRRPHERIPPSLPGGRPVQRDRTTELTVRGVAKSFGGVRALRDVSVTVAAGEILAIIGPNGSGKSTLLNVMSGLVRPDGGRMTLNGCDLASRSAAHHARIGIGRTFQTPTLPAGLTVAAAVALPAQVTGIALPVDALLAKTGLTDLRDRDAASLPLGLRRRVEIARALALSPRILLLDEPAAGLSTGERASLATLLRTLAREGIAIVVVDHAMDFLLPLADRVACLDAGRLIALGRPEAVRRDPAVIAAYLGDQGDSENDDADP